MKRYLIQLFALVVSLFIYFVNLSALPYIGFFHNTLKTLVQPLFEFKGNLIEFTKSMINTYVILVNVSKENQELKKELQACNLYKVQLSTCENNLLSVSRIINLPLEVKRLSIVYAGIIAYDPSGNDTFILINKGQDAGLSEGMIAFYEDKLIGIVDRVYGSSARIRTVFSKDFSISAMANSKAYIYKGGYPYGFLLHVGLEDPIKVGDVVLLRSPLGNIPSFTIGKVSRISEEDKGFFKRVEVKPAVDIRRISYCILIKEKL